MDVLKHNTKPKLSIPGTTKQNFCFSSSIIYYITKHPSTPKCYKKMIQCCKHFFSENPLLIVGNLYGNRICSDHDGQCFINCVCKWSLTIKIKKCLSKIWLLNALSVNGKSFSMSLLCPKIYYRSEIKFFMISDINVNFDDFKILVFKATAVHLYNNVKITYKSGKILMLEEILEAIPNIKCFRYHFTNNSLRTSNVKRNIIQFQSFKNLTELYLFQIPELLNLKDLSNFIKDNKKMLLHLVFASNISEPYKNQLDALIDTIIESKIPGRFVDYPNMNKEKHEILQRGLQTWREMNQHY